jgi:hypothetical protein
VVQEVERNLAKFPPHATRAWHQIHPQLAVRDNVYASRWPVVFSARKDRPILFIALAYAHVLLTLDRADFMHSIGQRIYGLDILTPGSFLERERQKLK